LTAMEMLDIKITHSNCFGRVQKRQQYALGPCRSGSCMETRHASLLMRFGSI